MIGRSLLCAAIALVLFSIPGAHATGTPVLGEKLKQALRSAGPADELTVWIHFVDKGAAGLRKPDASALVSARSLARRLKVRAPDEAVDFSDLPVEPAYVEQVRRTGARIRQQSRWFNAVSATVTVEQIGILSTLPVVRDMELLFRARRDMKWNPVERRPDPAPGLAKTGGKSALDYGLSGPQVSLLRIPEVHNSGNTGQDVLVGVFDNGFRLPTHESFDSLTVLGTRDFVDHKESVVPSNPDPSFGAHGIYTLAALAGFRTGQLVGPAYGATYLLARTENDSSETPVEEDNWVAAIEWADSIGVQVTSTSLGYLTYDSPYPSWTWRDMDGQTTKISLAATMAARKGIVVLNSAGNNYSNPDTNINTLNAPADADSILAVGAVTPTGVRAGFSSVGPTTSIPPRIKPDIMATGTSIYTASPTQPTAYVYVQGTSLSCPLAAGVAAMMLHAVPQATPMQVIESLKMTGSQASHPDNRMGWGVIDAVRAIDYLKTLTGVLPPELPAEASLDQNYPNPFNPRTVVSYQVSVAGEVRLVVYDLLGREVAVLVSERKDPGRYRVEFDAAGLSSGVYLYRLQTGGYTRTRKLMVLR